MAQAVVFERDARTGDEVAHRGGHQHFAGTGQGSHARPDVHRDAGQLVANNLDLARMKAATNRDRESSQRVAHRDGAADRPRRPVEGREEPVAGRIDLPSAVAGQDLTHRGVVVLQQ